MPKMPKKKITVRVDGDIISALEPVFPEYNLSDIVRAALQEYVARHIMNTETVSFSMEDRAMLIQIREGVQIITEKLRNSTILNPEAFRSVLDPKWLQSVFGIEKK